MGSKYGWFTFGVLLWFGLSDGVAHAAASRPTGMARHPAAHASTAHSAAAAHGKRPASHSAVVHRGGARPVLAVRRTRKRVFSERFTANSFADNLTLGDTTAGEDPMV